MSQALVVFTDSNILFSTRYRTPNLFEPLWDIPSVHVVTSHYCVREARRHLQNPSQIANFDKILSKTELVQDCPKSELPETLMLHAKDVPVLAAARCHADILITGDKNHFGRYFGLRVQGVLIESPSMFRSRFAEVFQR